MSEQANPTVLITGASSGIGLAAAKACLDQGRHVLGVSRSIETLDFSHPHFKKFGCDLSKTASIPSYMREVQVKFPDVEALVLCAGKGLFGKLESLSPFAMEELLTLNFHSQAMMAKAYVPLFKKRQKGHLIFIGSEAALAGKKEGSIYCASKFALRGFCQALREECAKDGVKVSLIHPGLVKTPFFDGLHFSPKEEEMAYLHPEDIALSVLHCLSSPPHLSIDEIVVNPLRPSISKNT